MPMAQDDSFDGWMARLAAGDESAATQVFRRFVRRLVGLARVHLDTLIRRKVDPEDVVQSAFKSFFLRFADRRFELKGWGGLWALLEAVRVETYLGRYPDLTSDPAVVLGLIAAEYLLRRRAEPGLAKEEYIRRFPALAAQLPPDIGSSRQDS